jgi:hypothetical protein
VLLLRWLIKSPSCIVWLLLAPPQS